MEQEEIRINNLALKIMRNEYSLSQNDLAKMLDCDQSYISKLEALNSGHGISFEFFIRLCRVYKKSPTSMCNLLGIKIH